MLNNTVLLTTVPIGTLSFYRMASHDCLIREMLTTGQRTDRNHEGQQGHGEGSRRAFESANR